MWKHSEESGGKRGSLFAGRRKAVASSTPERGYWHVWTAEEATAAHFKTVPAVERVLLNCSVAQVTAVLQDRPGPAGWWPSSTKLDSTTISLLEREQGRVRYLRNSKTTNGLIQTRIRLWTTQWVDVLDAHAAVVQMHQWDESGAVHLISRLCCTDGAPLGHGIDSGRWRLLLSPPVHLGSRGASQCSSASRRRPPPRPPSFPLRQARW